MSVRNQLSPELFPQNGVPTAGRLLTPEKLEAVACSSQVAKDHMKLHQRPLCRWKQDPALVGGRTLLLLTVPQADDLVLIAELAAYWRVLLSCFEQELIAASARALL
jgi:hypothetical protein